MNKKPSSYEASRESVNPINVLGSSKDQNDSRAGVMQKASGAFYTPAQIGKYLAGKILDVISHTEGPIHVCDPFAGDGRLIEWLLVEGKRQGFTPSWKVALWDIHEAGIIEATERFNSLKSSGLDISLETWVGDSFERLCLEEKSYDVILTNPPWENLKPDRRELDAIPEHLRNEYVEAIRMTASRLEKLFPNSRALKKYGGWGTNLSRVGTEAALRSVEDNGILGIVLPLSFLADQASSNLRAWLLSESSVCDIGSFPAEAKPFIEADVGACTLIAQKIRPKQFFPQVTFFDKNYSIQSSEKFKITIDELCKRNYILPFGFGMNAAKVSTVFEHFPTFQELEQDPEWGLWAGRELDETRISNHLNVDQGPLFVKGRMVTRFELIEAPTFRVQKDNWNIPPSVEYERIVWRDVSRSSQKRRIIATIIPPGVVAGNSLGVAYLKNENRQRLLILLGLMSSLPFEIQLRSQLATGHVSLASLRTVRIPNLSPSSVLGKALAEAVAARLSLKGSDEHRIESLAMHAFKLTMDEAELIISCFPKILPDERKRILAIFCQLEGVYANS